MNFKLLFPSFRNRFVFVEHRLRKLTNGQPFRSGLNLGTGEGDYDRMIAQYCIQLVGCDVNGADLAHARKSNEGITNLHYECNDAQSLSYPNEHFGIVVSCEVIEHVIKPSKMVQEISRVLEPGGYALLTFPNRNFPLSYDPLNWFWHRIKRGKGREYLVHQGAYAFGHDRLIDADNFKKWAAVASLEVVECAGISRYLAGLFEMYWTGIIQWIFKRNSGNVTTENGGLLKIRPSTVKVPFLAYLTDCLLWIDRKFFSWGSASVGIAVVLRKEVQRP